MNDYQKVRKYLEGLSEDEFHRFLGKFDLHVVEEPNKKGIVYAVYEQGGSKQLDASTWRKELTDDFLISREKNRSYWNEICYAADINPDDAEHLRLSNKNTRLTAISVIVSIAAIVIAIFAYLRDAPKE